MSHIQNFRVLNRIFTLSANTFLKRKIHEDSNPELKNEENLSFKMKKLGIMALLRETDSCSTCSPDTNRKQMEGFIGVQHIFAVSPKLHLYYG